MKLEIDQSGKIEATHRDTILAAVNGFSHTVKITARTKRRLQEVFRKIGRPRDFVICLFTIAVYELIKDYLNQRHTFVIDLEYPGHEKLITEIFQLIFNKNNINPKPEIYFSLIGRKSNAHVLALKTFQRQRPANTVLTFDQIFGECFIYKNGHPALKYPVGKDR